MVLPVTVVLLSTAEENCRSVRDGTAEQTASLCYLPILILRLCKKVQ